jgi:thioredoxin 1
MKIKIFTADWCKTCKMYTDELKKQNIEFESIDIKHNPTKAIKYKVRALPTTVLMNDRGNFVLKFAGTKLPDDLRSMIEDIENEK